MVPPGLRNEDVPALFWDTLPEEDSENPDAAAIRAIIEESTPEERAEGFKVRLQVHCEQLAYGKCEPGGSQACADQT